MADVVVGISNHGIDVGLIFPQHGAAIEIRVRIVIGIGVDELAVVTD
jgi:hypothetical protein